MMMMIPVIAITLALALPPAMAQASGAVLLHAAGSLRAALTEAGKRFEDASAAA